jgi:hypothetical protein
MSRIKYACRQCNECGQSYEPSRRDEFFCSIPCRKQFDNRAMVRGRDLYHLFMVMRYERGLAKTLGIWAIICRMALSWRQEDEAERGGRKSWDNPQKVIGRLPVVMQAKEATVIYQRAGR